ncbi:response regulator transcription factor [Piscinibacter sp. HJYY11]|uniref:response regulator n=1 Tax=Piscinibacter sp. HJYY11 TaxID=2801333 RepID=UPI00191F9956|nr:response regulator transcription factor [Piscinibacter sp. HJYY11]MBL0729510.1 response regulator transcription factor [Piscinibacter sp. HJYY11]
MRFLIVDDHPILRLGVRHLLHSAWPEAEIVEAETLEQAVERLTAAPPQLVVLDLSLGDATGTEAPARLLRMGSGVPILVLSLNAEPSFAARLLQMGVSGYLPKSRAADELVTAARRVLGGHRYVTAEMADHLLGLLSGDTPGALPHERLSAQEYRVMTMIAAGRSPAEIAEAMHLSTKTVSSYRARIFVKAGWSNNTELTKYCVQHGLTDPL